MRNSILTKMIITAAIFACFSISLFATSMTAIVANGTTTIPNQQNSLNAEVFWIHETGNYNQNGWGAEYYHPSGYAGHSYRLLEPDANPYPSFGDNYARNTDNINGNSYPTIHDFETWTRLNESKIFLAHARRQSPGEPAGVFAPFIYRYNNNTPNDATDDIDYSFAHHGFIDKQDMIDYLPGFHDWLVALYPAYHNTPANYVDSDFLFLWIIKNVVAQAGNVRLGLMSALQTIRNTSQLSDAQINIFFSDGNGMYAYTNRIVNEDGYEYDYYMQYTTQVDGTYTSYKVRSHYIATANWNYCTSRSLYYFPTTGNIEITASADLIAYTNFTYRNGINYVAFPMINGTTTQTANSALQSVNYYATSMIVTAPGSAKTATYYFNDTTQLWPNFSVSRTNGYTLTMENTFTSYTNYASGTYTDYDTQLTFYSAYQTCVPYFIAYSQTPADAFGTNYQYVTAIYAEDWYAYKQNGIWYGYLEQGATGTLDYGHMYKVSVSQNFTQFWPHIGKNAATPFEAITTEFFTANELPSYQAVEISSIKNAEGILEIGAFENGVCVGASRVTGYPVHMQVFTTTAPELLDYRVMTESNSATPTTISAVTVVDQVIKDGVAEFSILSFGDKQVDSTLPVAQIKASAYPNPFRNSMSINLESAKDTAVKVSIFNAKGEKVSELYNGILTKGTHNLVWNGKTTNGNPLSQGVYFYRVESGNNTQTQKLLMLK